MTLYTTVPQELIFPYDESQFAKQMNIDIKEGQLVIEAMENQQFRVVRLISSDPMAFLNENYTPGKMISLF
ncbi:YlzJ-like family protein [Bacillaceae bacterium IKA-2]|nr:YlzJ-like family protein [Bacillaceae bacterium IKA-2]